MPPQNTVQPQVSEVASQAPLNTVPPPPRRKFSKIAIAGAVLVAILLIVFFVIRFFTGGGRDGASIVWWGLWEDEVVVAPLIAEYESQNPGVKIEYVKQSPQDYRERLANALARGEGPDIFRYHNTWVPMLRNELDAVPVGVMNPADFATTFYPIASSDLSLGSNFLGIPLEYDAITLFINLDIFNKSGKSAPTTWDELRLLARELTVKDDQNVITQSGVAMGRTENVDHWPEILALLMLQNGVDLANPVGKPAEDAITFFTIFSLVDGVWDVSLPSSTQSFASGKLAMYMGPSWRAFDIAAQNPNLEFRTVPIPQLPKDTPDQVDITYATYWAEGVSIKSPQKVASWNFLKFMSSRETQEKFYLNASRVRSFGEPYSRVDMADLLLGHPILGSIIKQAPGATSWYLASRTFDGPTGINSQLASYFEDAVNAVASGQSQADRVMETLSSGVNQVLTQYRLVAQ
jgi:multiple sugar transport system substrate-binding protein